MPDLNDFAIIDHWIGDQDQLMVMVEADDGRCYICAGNITSDPIEVIDESDYG